MPSGSRRTDVGSDHHSPLKVFCWIFLVPHAGFDHLDDHVDADVLPHLGDHLGHGLVIPEVPDRRLEEHGLAAVAGPAEPIPSLPGRVREGWQRRVVVIVPSGDRPARHEAPPPPDLLHDRVPIDGQRQGLPDERLVERRHPDIDREHVEPSVGRSDQPGRRIRGHALAVLGRELRDEIRVAVEQRVHACRRAGHGAKDHAVQVEAPIPVVGVGLEDALLALGPRHEAERPGSHRDAG